MLINLNSKMVTGSFMFQSPKLLWVIILVVIESCVPASDSSVSNPPKFNLENDLLLAQFDCKTDVDDLHSAAALATILRSTKFKDVKYHAVAGAYGTQDGLYVPANDLFVAAFGSHWSDAHTDHEEALKEVTSLVVSVIEDGGDVWIPEAGQSDFSAKVVQNVKSSRPDLKTKERIHIVQHSNWNEEVTSSRSLEFVKVNTDYNKIPDGNVVGNGSPGFRSEEIIDWQSKIEDPDLVTIWNLALTIGNQYNGKEGRYENEAITNGGLDFSDLSETCWILGLDHIVDAREFFEVF